MILTCNVGLFDALFAEPFGKDVGHCLRGEGNFEGELSVVARHSGDILARTIVKNK